MHQQLQTARGLMGSQLRTCAIKLR